MVNKGWIMKNGESDCAYIAFYEMKLNETDSVLSHFHTGN